MLMASRRTPAKKSAELAAQSADESVSVPAESVEILRASLGADVTKDPERLRAVIEMAASVSASPYPSADMLAAYVANGLPELVDKVVGTINQQVAHRQSLERLRAEGVERRQGRAQWGAVILGVIGTLGALGGAYLSVPPLVCIVVAIVAVGGPNAATIVGRILDRVDRASRG